MPGLYSSGLFVTTEGLSMKAPTVINFGWGSPARPPSTDRSSLRHNEVKRAMANIVSNPATEVERNRARAGLLYLLNGRQEGENGAQLLESDQHGYWENTLPRNALYPLFGFSVNPTTKFVAPLTNKKEMWALELLNALVNHQATPTAGRYASPPLQVLDHPKEANAWLFPQMNGVEVLYEAMSLLRSGMNTWLPDVGEIVRVEAWNGDQCETFDDAVLSMDRFCADHHRPGEEPRGTRRIVHKAAFLALQLCAHWLNLNRTDAEEGVALFPTIKNVVHVHSFQALENFCFHLEETLYIVTGNGVDYETWDDPYAFIQKGLLRQIIFALATAEREESAEAMYIMNEEFGHRFHGQMNEHSITVRDLSDFYVEVLQVLRRYRPLASSDDESVRGREEDASDEENEEEAEEPERNVRQRVEPEVAQGVAVDLLPVCAPALPVGAPDGPGVIEAPLAGGAAPAAAPAAAESSPAHDIRAARTMGIWPPRPSERAEPTLALPAIRRGFKRLREFTATAQMQWELELHAVTQRARDVMDA